MSALPVFVSPLLDRPGLAHAFFTRQGGVSMGVYASLNVGVGSGDDPDAVAENRRRAAAHFSAPPEQLRTCYQIHSARVVIAETATPGGRPRADGLVTREPGLVLGVLAADCAPVLLADAEAGVVGAVHAGWRGALAGVIEAGVAAMEGLGARRPRTTAAIGPCIGPASYEVGLELLAAFAAADPGFEQFFAAGATPEKRQFDLPGFVEDRLKSAGVAQAAWIGADTLTDEDQFFSNRRAFLAGEHDYGRLLSAIMVREPNDRYASEPRRRRAAEAVPHRPASRAWMADTRGRP